MDLGLSGKRALVLGASRGLGAAVAHTLAREGASVIAAARSAGSMVQMANITAHTLDVGDIAAVDALIATLLPDGVDIIVNNCGGPPPGAALDTSRGQYIAQFEPMVANLIHLTTSLLPPMVARKWGRVITIGSSGVEQPLPRLVISNALRAAVAGWSKTLASEVAPFGITVNMVLPGRIRTDRTTSIDGAAASKSGKSVEQVEAESTTLIPAGRYGDPQEFADVVAFLAGVPASYLTGSMIRVDGGLIRSV